MIKLFSGFARWFKNKNIRVKINMIYIILIVGQTLLLTVFSNAIVSRSFLNSAAEQFRGDSTLVLNNIENIMLNAEGYANDMTVQMNNYFVPDYDRKVSNEYSNYSLDTMLKKIFRNELYVYPQLYGIMFISTDGRVVSSDNLIPNGNYEAITRANRNIDRNSQGCVWLKMGEYNFQWGNTVVLPVCKRIVNINSGRYIGFLSIMLKETTFSKIYNNIGKEKNAKFFLCDDTGTVVSSSDSSEILKPVANAAMKEWIIHNGEQSTIMDLDGKRVLVMKSDFPKLGWKLIDIVPMIEITGESNKIGVTIILFGILCTFIAMLLSNVLSSSITKPLYRLIYDVQHLKLDNLSAMTQVESGDDVGLLAESFNSMKRRINELLVDGMKQKEKQRKSELQLLQAQIKPHFFYNSLQMIYAMIEMNDKEKAQNSVKSLAGFYRTVLSNGNDIITVGEELSNTADYLYIQKIRYSDDFDYRIECAEELKKYRILKLTLQPIVENSVCHGFAGRKIDNGMIKIQVVQRKNTIVIQVGDNGVGLSQEKIARIFSDQNSAAKESFGLKNIDERIKLYYGYSYGLKISSEGGKGTVVSIYIPALENPGEAEQPMEGGD